MEKLINLKTTALRAWNTSGLPNNIDEKEQVLGDGDENRNWEMVRNYQWNLVPETNSVTIRQDIIF